MKTSMTPETAEGLRGFNLTGGGELDDARSASLRMRAKMVVSARKRGIYGFLTLRAQVAMQTVNQTAECDAARHSPADWGRLRAKNR